MFFEIAIAHSKTKITVLLMGIEKENNRIGSR